MEKTIVFVDIDGTVAQWLPTTTPEELVAPGYFQNLPPYTQMVENVRYLIRHGVQVYRLRAIRLQRKISGWTSTFQKSQIHTVCFAHAMPPSGIPSAKP